MRILSNVWKMKKTKIERELERHNDDNRLEKYTKKLKSIKKKLKNTKKMSSRHKKRLKRKKVYIQKKLYNLDHKVENIVKDVHWKIASYYCNNYNTVIIPKFDVNSIKKRMKRDRKAKSDTRIRRLMSLSHGKFMERLKYKCMVTGTKLCIVDEEYTTKSCGNCGLLNDPGKSKIFTCDKCYLCIGRDTNAARNILIKKLLTLAS